MSVSRRATAGNSSYYGEIYRVEIESVGTGQLDATRSTGFG